jgi:centromeric protein E
MSTHLNINKVAYSKLQQELLAARVQLESQATQILSLEASLIARPLPSSASDNEKDKLVSEQAKTIRELEIAIRGYEDNLGEPLRAVREDVEKEWVGKFEDEVKKRKESERWAAEVVKQLEREKQVRTVAFIIYFDLSDVVGCVGETEVGRRTTSVSDFCH